MNETSYKIKENTQDGLIYTGGISRTCDRNCANSLTDLHQVIKFAKTMIY